MRNLFSLCTLVTVLSVPQPKPIQNHNQSLNKQKPSMEGDSSWSVRLFFTSRCYQSTLRSRLGSLLFSFFLFSQFNSFCTFSLFPLSLIKDEVFKFLLNVVELEKMAKIMEDEEGGRRNKIDEDKKTYTLWRLLTANTFISFPG